MDRFTVIEDAVALVRYPKGVQKIVDVYRRGAAVFIPHSGGFVRVCAFFDGRYSTGHPDIKVEELEIDGVRPKEERGYAVYG